MVTTAIPNSSAQSNTMMIAIFQIGAMDLFYNKLLACVPFWDLQQEQGIQKDEEWQKKMIDIEMRVSQNPDFQNIAFFHHLIFEKL